MRPATRLGGFTAAVGLVATAAYGVGQLVGPVGQPPAVEQHAAMPGADGGHEPDQHAELTPAGLTVTERGYTLDLRSATAPAGRQTELRFGILDPHGAALTTFRPNHDKLMHLIVVRRDLSGYRHLHPTMAADGTWRVRTSFAEAGQYRVFADFLPPDGDGLTLGADLAVAGTYRPRPLPAPAAATTVDGYTVTLTGQLTAGQRSPLTLAVRRAGAPVTDLQPYLGAYGHLIALRDRDLAYLHVHPGDGPTEPGPEIDFAVEVPTTGTYRLFLDFQHQGVVRTAALTVEVTGVNPHREER